MLEELVNTTVEIYIVGFDGGKVKGKLLRVDDTWAEVATKKRVELINISAIKIVYAAS